MSNDSDKMAARLAVALEVNQPLPRDIAAWLSDGLQRYNKGRQSVTLNAALGLGKTTKSQRSERNEWLCIACDRATVNTHLSNWERSKRLADLVSRFERHQWPRLEKQTQPPKELPSRYEALFWAKKAVNGAPLSTSPNTLYKLLRQNLYDSA